MLTINIEQREYAIVVIVSLDGEEQGRDKFMIRGETMPVAMKAIRFVKGLDVTYDEYEITGDGFAALLEDMVEATDAL